MSLEDDGYLSEEAKKQAAEFAAEYKQIFNYLRDVNTKAHQFLREAEVSNDDGRGVFAAAFLARALTAFQALSLLAERGFLSECRVICRNILEVKFRLGFLERKDDAFILFLAEHDRSRIKRLRDMRDGKIRLGDDLKKPDWDALIAKAEANLRNPDGSEKRLPQISKMAEEAGFESDYRGYYRFLSDAIHSGAGELEEYVAFNEEGEVSGFSYGPQKNEWLPWITLCAASALIDCLQISSLILRTNSSNIHRFLEERKKEMMGRYYKLMMDGISNS